MTNDELELLHNRWNKVYENCTIEELKEAKWSIDMIDKWTEEDREHYDFLSKMIKAKENREIFEQCCIRG